jgi:hypothetical protein
MALLIGIIAPIYAQKAVVFNVEKFEKALVEQMEITFPGMTLDTSLNFATSATSQAEADASVAGIKQLISDAGPINSPLEVGQGP